MEGNSDYCNLWCKEFGIRLKTVMKEKDVTQEELADKIDVSNVTVNHWANGKRSPLAPTVSKISETLEVPVEYLMNGSNRILVDINEVEQRIGAYRKAKMLTPASVRLIREIIYGEVQVADMERNCKKKGKNR